MSGPSAGSAVDHHLVDTLLPSLFPAATVLRGSPGTQVEQDVVSLQSTTVDDAQVCMGPQRRRDETMRVTLLISCTRPGDHTVQADADDAAWAMLSTLRDELRVATTPNLGGRCGRLRCPRTASSGPRIPSCSRWPQRGDHGDAKVLART